VRLSPSIIESYEYWRDHDWDDPEQEQAKLAELIAQVKGERFPATRQMRRGTAFHTALEVGAVQVAVPGWNAPVLRVEVDGFEFLFDAPSAAEVADQMPQGLIREVPGTITVADVDIHYRVDGLHGYDVRELKTTENTIDTDQYVNAIQWRVYLLASSAKRCIYDIVKFKQDSMTGVYTVSEYLPLPLYAYSRMRDNVEKRVSECARWVESMGLAEYRQAKVAA